MTTSTPTPTEASRGATPIAAFRRRLTTPSPATIALLLATVGVVIDQATKVLAERVLDLGVFVPWLSGQVGWQLVYNPGAAFGIPAPPWVFLIVTIIVVGIVARALPASDTLLQATAYGLLLSGAIGNLFDRVLRAQDGPMTGEVVDFVAWGTFPRFNLADSWITIGFVLLVLALWREERAAAAAEEDAADAPAARDDAAGDPA